MRVTYSRLEGAGRLGNQMWQVAATVGIARTLGLDPHVVDTWSYRPWFSLPEGWYRTNASTMEADTWDGLGHIDPRARMYLQDLGLFAHCSEEIRRIFRPSHEALRYIHDDPVADHLRSTIRWDDDGKAEAIALHVRRGDTVTQPKGFQPLAPIGYYRRALASLPDLPVVVFSDDPRWCNHHLARHIDPFLVVDHGNGRSHHLNQYHRQPATDWLDLQLMAQFSYHVISNSTYAWWSGFLSSDPDVRYPSVWWGPKLGYIDSDLMIPPGWVEIPC